MAKPTTPKTKAKTKRKRTSTSQRKALEAAIAATPALVPPPVSTLPPSNAGKPGRPSKFNPERVERIIGLANMAPGNMAAVAQASGIAEKTLRDWLRRGQEVEDDDSDPEQQEYRRFSLAYRKAQGYAQILAENRILKAGEDPKYWTANAWYLERMNPAVFGRPQQIELSGPRGGPIELSDADKRGQVEALVIAVLSAGGRLEDVGLPPMPDDLVGEIVRIEEGNAAVSK